MIKYLHCFVVINENESALIIGSKLNPFFCDDDDTNLSPKERCTTDDMSTVSAGGPVIFLFQTRSFKEFKKKGDSSKTSEFFLNKLYHLTSGFDNNNNKDFI